MRYTTGWKRPPEDKRDYDGNKLIAIRGAKPVVLPSKVDNAKSFSQVRDQDGVGACQSFAIAALVECLLKKKGIENVPDYSESYVYRVLRDLNGIKNKDSGGSVRDALKAVVKKGICREKDRPFLKATYNKPITEEQEKQAGNITGLKYYRLDLAGTSPEEILHNIKQYVSMGYPVALAFMGYDSFEQVNIEGGIPYPNKKEKAQWGHAVAISGYDDEMVIVNTKYGITTVGALYVHNSWGDECGNKGIWYLPYEYVLTGLACDIWVLTDEQQLVKDGLLT